MSDLRELYQQLIIDHGRSPRNFAELPAPARQKQGFNPLCGDQLQLYVLEQDGVVQDVKFKGTGCAISMASASMMTEAVKGKSVAEAKELFDRFHDMVTNKDAVEDLGKLAVLAGVREFPSRVKCATLAWHTLNAVLHEDDGVVSTE